MLTLQTGFDTERVGPEISSPFKQKFCLQEFLKNII